MKNKIALKIIAAIVANVFTFTTVVWSAPDTVYRIKINQTYGNVEQRYKGNSNKTVIHIQDAHGSLEAQKNIAHLITDLVGANTAAVVGVEGAVGKVDMSAYRSFPVREARNAAAQRFMKEGKFSGAEYAAIIADADIPLYGIEDKDLFVKNLKDYYQTSLKREDILDSIEAIEAALQDLKTPVFNPDLMAFDAIMTSYEHGDSTITEIAPELYEQMARFAFDDVSFPSLAQFRDVLGIEMQLDKTEAEEEKEKLTAQLTEKEGTRDFSGVSSSEECRYLKNRLMATGMDSASYRQFLLWCEYQSQYGRINATALAEEVEKVSFSIRMALAERADEKRLIQYIRATRLLRSVILLTATRKEALAFLNHQNAFSATALYAFIREAGARYGRQYRLNDNAAAIHRVVMRAVTFYEDARKRDHALVENLMQTMEKDDVPTAILLSGGFHSAGVVDELKARGINYLTVMPQMTSAVTDIPYGDKMTGKLMPFSEAMTSYIYLLLSAAQGAGIVTAADVRNFKNDFTATEKVFSILLDKAEELAKAYPDDAALAERLASLRAAREKNMSTEELFSAMEYLFKDYAEIKQAVGTFLDAQRTTGAAVVSNRSNAVHSEIMKKVLATIHEGFFDQTMMRTILHEAFLDKTQKSTDAKNRKKVDADVAWVMTAIDTLVSHRDEFVGAGAGNKLLDDLIPSDKVSVFNKALDAIAREVAVNNAIQDSSQNEVLSPFPQLKPGDAIKGSDLYNALSGKSSVRNVYDGGPIKQPDFFFAVSFDNTFAGKSTGEKNEAIGIEQYSSLKSTLQNPAREKSFEELVTEYLLSDLPQSFVFKLNSVDGGVGVAFFEVHPKTDEIIVRMSHLLFDDDKKAYSELSAKMMVYLDMLLEANTKHAVKDVSEKPDENILEITFKRSSPVVLNDLMEIWRLATFRLIRGKAIHDAGMVEKRENLIKANDRAYEVRTTVQGNLFSGNAVLMKKTGYDDGRGWFARIGSSGSFSNVTNRSGKKEILTGDALYGPLSTYVDLKNPAIKERFEKYIDTKIRGEFKYLVRRLHAAGIYVDQTVNIEYDLMFTAPRKQGAFPEPMLIESTVVSDALISNYNKKKDQIHVASKHIRPMLAEGETIETANEVFERRADEVQALGPSESANIKDSIMRKKTEIQMALFHTHLPDAFMNRILALLDAMQIYRVNEIRGAEAVYTTAFAQDGTLRGIKIIIDRSGDVSSVFHEIAEAVLQHDPFYQRYAHTYAFILESDVFQNSIERKLGSYDFGHLIAIYRKTSEELKDISAIMQEEKKQQGLAGKETLNDAEQVQIDMIEKIGTEKRQYALLIRSAAQKRILDIVMKGRTISVAVEQYIEDMYGREEINEQLYGMLKGYLDFIKQTVPSGNQQQEAALHQMLLLLIGGAWNILRLLALQDVDTVIKDAEQRNELTFGGEGLFATRNSVITARDEGTMDKDLADFVLGIINSRIAYIQRGEQEMIQQCLAHTEYFKDTDVQIVKYHVDSNGWDGGESRVYEVSYRKDGRLQSAVVKFPSLTMNSPMLWQKVVQRHYDVKFGVRDEETDTIVKEPLSTDDYVGYRILENVHYPEQMYAAELGFVPVVIVQDIAPYTLADEFEKNRQNILAAKEWIGKLKTFIERLDERGFKMIDNHADALAVVNGKLKVRDIPSFDARKKKTNFTYEDFLHNEYVQYNEELKAGENQSTQSPKDTNVSFSQELGILSYEKGVYAEYEIKDIGAGAKIRVVNPKTDEPVMKQYLSANGNYIQFTQSQMQGIKMASGEDATGIKNVYMDKDFQKTGLWNEELGKLLADALSRIRKQFPKDAYPDAAFQEDLYIAAVDQSPYLGGNHTKDGYVYINLPAIQKAAKAVPQKQRKDFMKLMIEFLLVHELRHEYTGDETEDSLFDVKTIIRLSEENHVDLKLFVQAIETVTDNGEARVLEQLHSLAFDGLVKEMSTVPFPSKWKGPVSPQQESLIRYVEKVYGVINNDHAIVKIVENLARQSLLDLGMDESKYAVLVADTDEVNAYFYNLSGQNVVVLTFGFIEYLRKNNILTLEAIKFVLGHECGHAVQSKELKGVLAEYDADGKGLQVLNVDDGHEAMNPIMGQLVTETFKSEHQSDDNVYTTTHPHFHRREVKIYNDIRRGYWKNLHGDFHRIPEIYVDIDRSRQHQFDDELYSAFTATKIAGLVSKAQSYHEIMKAMNLFTLVSDYEVILSEMHKKDSPITLSVNKEELEHLMLDIKGAHKNMAFAEQYLIDNGVNLYDFFSAKEIETITVWALDISVENKLPEPQINTILHEYLAYELYRTVERIQYPTYWRSTSVVFMRPFAEYLPRSRTVDDDKDEYLRTYVWEQKKALFKQKFPHGVEEELARVITGIEKLSKHDQEKFLECINPLRYLSVDYDALSGEERDKYQNLLEITDWDGPLVVIQSIVTNMHRYRNVYLKNKLRSADVFAYLYEHDNALLDPYRDYIRSLLWYMVSQVNEDKEKSEEKLQELLDTIIAYEKNRHIMPPGSCSALEQRDNRRALYEMLGGQIKNIDMLRYVIKELSPFPEAIKLMGSRWHNGGYIAHTAKQAESLTELEAVVEICAMHREFHDLLCGQMAAFLKKAADLGLSPGEAALKFHRSILHHVSVDELIKEENIEELLEAYAMTMCELVKNPQERAAQLLKLRDNIGYTSMHFDTERRTEYLWDMDYIASHIRIAWEEYINNPYELAMTCIEHGIAPDWRKLFDQYLYNNKLTLGQKKFLMRSLVSHKGIFIEKGLKETDFNDMITCLSYSWFFNTETGPHREQDKYLGSRSVSDMKMFLTYSLPSFYNLSAWKTYGKYYSLKDLSDDDFTVLFDLNSKINNGNSLIHPRNYPSLSKYEEFKNNKDTVFTRYQQEQNTYLPVWTGEEESQETHTIAWGNQLLELYLKHIGKSLTDNTWATEEKIDVILKCFPLESFYRNRLLIELIGDPLKASASSFEIVFGYLRSSQIKNVLAKRILSEKREQGLAQPKDYAELKALFERYFGEGQGMGTDLFGDWLQDVSTSLDDLREYEEKRNVMEKTGTKEFGSALHHMVEILADDLENRSVSDKVELFEWLIGVRHEKPMVVQFYECRLERNLSNLARWLSFAEQNERYMFLTTLFIGPKGVFKDSATMDALLRTIYEQGTGEVADENNELYMIFRELFFASPELKQLDLMSGIFEHFSERASGEMDAVYDKNTLISKVLSSFGFVGIKVGQIAGIENLSSEVAPLDKRYLLNAMLVDYDFETLKQRISTIGGLLGSASIKQAYELTKPDGSKRVIKYIRPLAHYEVKENMAILRVVLQRLKGKIDGVEKISGKLLDEVEKAVARELDIGQEIGNQQTIYEFSSGEKEGQWVVGIPAIDEELVGQQFFADELVNGEHPKDAFVNDMKTRGQQKPFIRLFLKTLLKQMLILGRYHADLNRGNLMIDESIFRENWIDFGNVGYLSRENQNLFIEFLGSLNFNAFESSYAILQEMIGGAIANEQLRQAIFTIFTSDTSIAGKLAEVKETLEKYDMSFQGEFEVLFKVFDTITYLTKELDASEISTIFRSVIMERQFKYRQNIFSQTTWRLVRWFVAGKENKVPDQFPGNGQQGIKEQEFKNDVGSLRGDQNVNAGGVEKNVREWHGFEIIKEPKKLYYRGIHGFEDRGILSEEDAIHSVKEINRYGPTYDGWRVSGIHVSDNIENCKTDQYSGGAMRHKKQEDENAIKVFYEGLDMHALTEDVLEEALYANRFYRGGLKETMHAVAAGYLKQYTEEAARAKRILDGAERGEKDEMGNPYADYHLDVVKKRYERYSRVINELQFLDQNFDVNKLTYHNPSNMRGYNLFLKPAVEHPIILTRGSFEQFVSDHPGMSIEERREYLISLGVHAVYTGKYVDEVAWLDPSYTSVVHAETIGILKDGFPPDVTEIANEKEKVRSFVANGKYIFYINKNMLSGLPADKLPADMGKIIGESDEDAEARFKEHVVAELNKKRTDGEEKITDADVLIRDITDIVDVEKDRAAGAVIKVFSAVAMLDDIPGEVERMVMRYGLTADEITLTQETRLGDGLLQQPIEYTFDRAFGLPLPAVFGELEDPASALTVEQYGRLREWDETQREKMIKTVETMKKLDFLMGTAA